MLSIEQACPYCGQFVAISTHENSPPWEREELAKERCGCERAQRDRDVKTALDKLRQIAGADSVENGFDAPLDDDALRICEEAVGWIIDMKVAEVQLSCSGGKMKLAYGGSGRVKISRKCQKQMAL